MEILKKQIVRSCGGLMKHRPNLHDYSGNDDGRFQKVNSEVKKAIPVIISGERCSCLEEF